MLDSITIARIYFSYGLLKPQLVFFSGGGGGVMACRFQILQLTTLSQKCIRILLLTI